MKRLAIILIMVFFLVYGNAASAKDVTVHLDFGATKVSGDLFEDTTHRMISGVGLFYSATNYLQFGFHGRYTKWTPDKVETLPGSKRIVDGSIRNIELMCSARIISSTESMNNFVLFGEFGLGYCILDSSAEVSSRPVVPDPGPYTLLYTIDSQNKPCVGVGFGVMYQITDRFGIEASGRYNYIFTDDKSTKYYSINGSLLVLLF